MFGWMDWDPDGLPCSESGTCEVGYSCFLPLELPSSDPGELRRCVEDTGISVGTLVPMMLVRGGLSCFEYQCTSSARGTITPIAIVFRKVLSATLSDNRKGACVEGPVVSKTLTAAQIQSA